MRNCKAADGSQTPHAPGELEKGEALFLPFLVCGNFKMPTLCVKTPLRKKPEKLLRPNQLPTPQDFTILIHYRACAWYLTTSIDLRHGNSIM